MTEVHDGTLRRGGPPTGEAAASLFRQRRYFALTLIAPAALILLLFQVLPILMGVDASLRRFSLTDEEHPFIGLRNYQRILTDVQFLWVVLPNTFFFMLASVAGGVVLGLAIAMLLKHPFPGRILVRTLIIRAGSSVSDQSDHRDVQHSPEPDYIDWRQRVRSLSQLAAFAAENASLLGDGDPRGASAMAATPSLFPLLGARPLMGRFFREDEAKPDAAARVVVLSNAAWQTRFGADPRVVGRTVNLSGTSYEIIGVMPPELVFPCSNPALWMPLAPSMTARGETARGAARRPWPPGA